MFKSVRVGATDNNGYSKVPQVPDAEEKWIFRSTPSIDTPNYSYSYSAHSWEPLCSPYWLYISTLRTLCVIQALAVEDTLGDQYCCSIVYIPRFDGKPSVGFSREPLFHLLLGVYDLSLPRSDCPCTESLSPTNTIIAVPSHARAGFGRRSGHMLYSRTGVPCAQRSKMHNHRYVACVGSAKTWRFGSLESTVFEV